MYCKLDLHHAAKKLLEACESTDLQTVSVDGKPQDLTNLPMLVALGGSLGDSRKALPLRMVGDQVAGPRGHRAQPLLCHARALELPIFFHGGLVGDLLHELGKGGGNVREQAAVEHGPLEGELPCVQL